MPYTLLLNKHVGRTFVLGSYKDPFAYVTKDYITGFVRSIYTTPSAADAILAAYPLKNYGCKSCAHRFKGEAPLPSLTFSFTSQPLLSLTIPEHVEAWVLVFPHKALGDPFVQVVVNP